MVLDVDKTKSTSPKTKRKLPEALETLGPTIQRLRKAEGYSLQDLSGESGIAKSILSRIENNETNPTLSTVWKLSQALNTNLDELLNELDHRPVIMSHHPAAQLPLLISEDGLCELRIIGDIETVEWAQVYELNAQVGGVLRSAPHPKGTVESLYVRQGIAIIEIGEMSVEVGRGEVVRYRGDLPHEIRSVGSEPLRATMTNLRR